MAMNNQQFMRGAMMHNDDTDSSSASASEDDFNPKTGMRGFNNPSVRMGFIRKVYGILCVQLFLTFIIAAPFNVIIPTEWVKANIGVFYGAMAASIAIICAMSCCGNKMREFPTNYIFLFAFTLCEAVMVGFCTSFYKTQSVLLALAATVVVFTGLTFYACCTKSDFTGCGPYLYAFLMTLLGFSLMIFVWSLFSPIPKWMHVLYSFLGVLVFSFYIVYDTQLIVGGAHKKHQFDVDDYAFAALNIYMDVIGLFLHLLSLLGDRK